MFNKDYMKDTAGNEIQNVPVMGCEGCRGTAGRLGCHIHGTTNLTFHHGEEKIKVCSAGHKHVRDGLGWNFCPTCGMELI